MKVCQITYQQMRQRHPDQLQEIMAALRSGKSKHKNANESDLKFEYECCVEVDGSGSLSNLINHHLGKPQQPQRDVLSRTHTAVLATIGRWWNKVEISRGCNHPPEVVDFWLKC